MSNSYSTLDFAARMLIQDSVDSGTNPNNIVKVLGGTNPHEFLIFVSFEFFRNEREAGIEFVHILKTDILTDFERTVTYKGRHGGGFKLETYLVNHAGSIPDRVQLEHRIETRLGLRTMNIATKPG